MISTANARKSEKNPAADLSPGAAHWLWRPWYAKLWWSAIPLWWTGMAASTQVASLERFYDGALAGFLNVLFFPLTAFMVLGVGYVQYFLARFSTAEYAAPLSDSAALMVADIEEQHVRASAELGAATDIFDPRSDGLFVGNPLSLQNPHRHI